MEIQVSFTNSKEQKLAGMLHMPEKEKAPAIIFCHGFGRNKVDKFRIWVRLAKELCKKGFVVLRFDFSGHGDSDGKMEDILPSQELDDLDCAINYIKSMPKVNKEKIGVMGHSLGGEIAIFESLKNDSIKAVALLAPVVDYKKIKGHFPYALSRIEKEEYVELASHNIKKQFFLESKKLKPLENIKKVNIPIMVIHGKMDDNVDVEGSKELIEKANEPKKIIILENADHDFVGYKTAMQMIN